MNVLSSWRQMLDALPEAATLSARELLHLGERAAVDQALSLLVRRGELMRVRRPSFAATALSPDVLLCMPYWSRLSSRPQRLLPIFFPSYPGVPKMLPDSLKPDRLRSSLPPTEER